MKDLKKLYMEQLDFIDSRDKAKLIYASLVRLNNKLERYDTPIGNARDAIREFLAIGRKGKMRAVISDIFDHYDDYNATDKVEIRNTLQEIQHVIHSTVTEAINYKAK